MWPFSSPLNLGPISDSFYEGHTLSLGPSDIRVLRLHRGSGQDDEITCTLERRYFPPLSTTSNRRPGLDCMALSYTWGDTAKNLRKILCNGDDFIVTKNLYSALYHLRSSHSDSFLWIDAVCVDQNNSSEKATQVQRMGEIYSRALHTVIWLGDANLLSREGLRACSKFALNAGADPAALPTLLPRPPWWDPWELLPPFFLLLLLRCPYFTRIWIVQEAALSRNLQIACGAERISWSNFSLGAITILEAGFGSRGSAGIGNILVARSLLPGAPKSGYSDPANVFKALKQHKVPQTKDILSLAILFRRSHATDPVDKLFGLLGLCEQIQAGGTYAILPTYSRDDISHKSRVYISTARRIMAAQNSLLLFSAVNRRPPSFLGDFVSFLRRIWLWERQAPALPTWVPDWNDSGSVATPLSLMLAQAHNVGVTHTQLDLTDPYKPRSVNCYCSAHR